MASLLNVNYTFYKMLYDILPLDGLVKLCESNSLLKDIFVGFFETKHRRSKVFLHNFGVNRFIEREEQILIEGSEFVVSFIRCFGAAIYDLVIVADENLLNWALFEMAFVTYSVNIVRVVTFARLPLAAFKYATNPFIMVETVHFCACRLNDNITDFNLLFPKMNCLVFHQNNNNI